ncbi:MAG: MgtC/SapB family protein [Pseudomonadota bacterium]|nr:MgtC/SapB family protein [Pseudomonadota bacterium]
MQDLDWNQVVTHLYQLGIAFVLALPVAWNREQRARGAGLRTFPLVSIAACGYMLVGMQVYSGSAAEARVMYGIITGMGFIGGGAILKNGATVSGTATAASLWNTGAIGISVAYSRYEIAMVLSVVNFLILQFSRSFKRTGEGKPE